MKNLKDLFNESLTNEAHVSTSSPHNEKELKAERAAYERDIKSSKKHQEELEADLVDSTKELERPGYKDMLERHIVAVKYMIAREKADQVYCEEMIKSIDELLKEIK